MKSVIGTMNKDDSKKALAIPAELILDDYEGWSGGLVIIAHLESWSRNKSYRVAMEVFEEWLDDQPFDFGTAQEIFEYCDHAIISKTLNDFIKSESFRNGATY